MTGLESIVGDHARVLVRQTTEWGEALLGFESKNRYELCTESGARLGFAAEEAKGVGAWFARNLLGHCRRASIHVYDAAGNEVGRGEKPFRWFFHRIEVFDGGQKVGAVQRKWSWLHRRLAIENQNGEEVMEIFSPLFRVWTFKLMFRGKEVGAVRKRWGGLLREMFTDADAFGMECSPEVPVEVRKLLLVATFLIDFAFFENNNGRRSPLDLLD